VIVPILKRQAVKPAYVMDVRLPAAEAKKKE